MDSVRVHQNIVVTTLVRFNDFLLYRSDHRLHVTFFISDPGSFLRQSLLRPSLLSDQKLVVVVDGLVLSDHLLAQVYLQFDLLELLFEVLVENFPFLLLSHVHAAAENLFRLLFEHKVAFDLRQFDLLFELYVLQLVLCVGHCHHRLRDDLGPLLPDQKLDFLFVRHFLPEGLVKEHQHLLLIELYLLYYLVFSQLVCLELFEHFCYFTSLSFIQLIFPLLDALLKRSILVSYCFGKIRKGHHNSPNTLKIFNDLRKFGYSAFFFHYLFENFVHKISSLSQESLQRILFSEFLILPKQTYFRVSEVFYLIGQRERLAQVKVNRFFDLFELIL